MIDYIELHDTHFVYPINLAGDPKNDPKYHSTEPKANIALPEDLALKLIDEGFDVRRTNPSEYYEPEYFIKVKLNFDSQFSKPVVKLIDNGHIVDIGKEQIFKIDRMHNVERNVKRLKVKANKWVNRDGKPSFYIAFMHVVKDVNVDPFAADYEEALVEGELDNAGYPEELPFD